MEAITLIVTAVICLVIGYLAGLNANRRERWYYRTRAGYWWLEAQHFRAMCERLMAEREVSDGDEWKHGITKDEAP